MDTNNDLVIRYLVSIWIGRYPVIVINWPIINGDVVAN